MTIGDVPSLAVRANPNHLLASLNHQFRRNRKKSEKPKLSYKDQRELDQLPEQIESIEQQNWSLARRYGGPSLLPTG